MECSWPARSSRMCPLSLVTMSAHCLTFPEIRAPAGTLGGVSGFQICFSSSDIYTPGDEVDTLIAMNPAALKTNVADLKRGGTLIVNEDAFEKSNLSKAGYDSNPLDDEESLAAYQLQKVPMTSLTRDAVAELGLSPREAERCKNFFAMGLVYWLYQRDATPTEEWVKSKFAKKPELVEANLKALHAGYNYGITTEAITVHYRVDPADLPSGNYRKVTGNEALAFGRQRNWPANSCSTAVTRSLPPVIFCTNFPN